MSHNFKPAFLGFYFWLLFCRGIFALPRCKTIPSDPNWPSSTEWETLNNTLGGALLKPVPVASSCWAGNPFRSPVPCGIVEANWTSGFFHSKLPESVDYPIYANNSCLPPGSAGFDLAQGCHLGGLPEYIVNATTENQVAHAVKWAAERNIRIIVKGTGHDLNGRCVSFSLLSLCSHLISARSSGAFSVSIWTRYLNKLERNPSWAVPNTHKTEDVFIVGSGQQWGNVLQEATRIGRVVTTGQDPSVGLGGYIQGGGHGPLSSTYGLAAHQVLQVTVVTTTGQILVANDNTNQDIFWALRGGGGGQYGVVTEYVIKHYPAPASVALGTLAIVPQSSIDENSNSSWEAAAALLAALPELMDAGVAGAGTLATGETAIQFSPSLQTSTKGIVVTQVFWAFNMTSAGLTALVAPLVAHLRAQSSNQTLSISWSAETFANYTAFYHTIAGSNAAGSPSLVSSRLLGRAELIDTPREEIVSHLRTALRAQNETAGTFATVGLQGGPGLQKVPMARWGAVNSVWRTAYIHLITYGATLNSSPDRSPKQALANAAAYMAEVREPMWRQWAPNTGAYMNEANPFDIEFKHDFYGTSYSRLMDIKGQYDPSSSLFVLSGVGSDEWDYDLDSGKLCRMG